MDKDAAVEVEDLGMNVLVTNTLMKFLDDRVMLAREIIAFSEQLK